MKFETKRRIILASGSPRREELLQMIGVPFEVVPSNVPEDDYIEGIDMAEYAMSLAHNKAIAVAEQYQDAVVIGADTIVAFESQVFPKPKNNEEAKKFLQQLSGGTHSVITGVVISFEGNMYRFAERTYVTFHELDDDIIDAYIASGDPFDKAGGYGIQSAGALFVDKIVGDYYSVVGLPISLLTQNLRTLEVITLKDGAAKYDR